MTQIRQRRRAMSASLIGRVGSSAFRLCTVAVSMSARGLVPLSGIGTKALIMGFEDEAEQSFGRSCRQVDGRSKRTFELTSSVVPRGTPGAPLVGRPRTMRRTETFVCSALAAGRVLRRCATSTNCARYLSGFRGIFWGLQNG